MSVIVKLDDPRYGAGPGTVVARVDTVGEFLALTTDRDGARDMSARMWAGDYPVGTRVVARQMERAP